jgi:redox-sensing transcriptional repressor
VPAAESINPAARRSVPEATVGRLAIYLRVIEEYLRDGDEVISSAELATSCGVNPAKLRKDVSFVGSFGTRGVGYDLAVLRDRLADALGLTETRDVVIVGVGNLGHALAGYGGLAARGFRLVGLFDADQRRIGERIGHVVVQPIEDLPRVVAAATAPIGVIATPATGAQSAAQRLIDAGVTSILNFASTILDVPDEIEVRKVDLASELQILSFRERNRGERIADGGTAS